MSDNVALALVYTGMQIFMTVGAMKQGVSSIVPYLALVVLVAGIIPACRWFERRWSHCPMTRSQQRSSPPSAATRSCCGLAIGLPAVLTAFFKLIFS